MKGLDNLNDTYFAPHFTQRFEVDIGVHFGVVISGEIKLGKETHTILMGLPVYVATRLQNATKRLNNNFIDSADAYQYYSQATDGHRSNTLLLKGIKKPVKVFFIGRSYNDLC